MISAVSVETFFTVEVVEVASFAKSPEMPRRECMKIDRFFHSFVSQG